MVAAEHGMSVECTAVDGIKGVKVKQVEKVAHGCTFASNLPVLVIDVPVLRDYGVMTGGAKEFRTRQWVPSPE